MDAQHSVRLHGLLNPEQLDLLSRVFSQAVTPFDTQQERTDRALAALALFCSGVTDEATLISRVSERLFTTDMHEAAFPASH